MATFPGRPPNALGFKAELNLNGTWTDITVYVMLRDQVQITNMGRADESGSISPSQLTMTLKNTDGRFTPKNTAGAYYPNIVRNCQVRVSVNATSVTGVNYSGFRFFGEIASWPPGYSVSQRDVYVSVTASGIWRRISQSSVPIGSCYWRWQQLQTGSNVPAAYWSMEDGSTGTTGLGGFILSEGTGTNMTVTSAPSYAADSTSFLGSNALPQPNGARFAANVTMASTPSAFAVWFAVSVPAAGDSGTSQFTTGGQLVKILTAGTVATIIVNITQGNQLNVSGQNASGTVLFTGTIPTKVNGVPVLCSYEQTAGAYALKIIKPMAGAQLDQVTASGFSWTTGKVTQVQVNSMGRVQDTTIGQLSVLPISTASIVTAAGYLGGQAGELAATRINRICTESNIPLTLIGSGGAAMGAQVSDTMSNILQGIEDTDGGLLYETTGQFGLGYRTLASMQNQAAALTISHTAGVLGDVLSPTYDDQLIKNQWTVTGPDGYAVTAQLNSGAMSISPPPNGVGAGYAASKTINANTHAQVNAIAQQLLVQGTVDEVRYPTVTVTFLRALAAPFFSSIPSLRLGDFFQISNLPAFLGGGTTKQLAVGYSETIGGEPEDWRLVFNTIPELPYETSFSPGSFTILQGSSGGVPQGSSVGATVSGSQIGPGAVGSPQAAVGVSARAIGGITQFVAAATPYKWTFAVTGTPSDATYFICTPDQALPIAVGDTFSSTSGLGSPFTVTQVDPASGGQVTVHFTPDATGVMSAGTVRGGTNGDQWVNTSAGNAINQWSAGVWNVLTFDGSAIINAGSIFSGQIHANTITASNIATGTIVAGMVDGTTIQGATLIAYGASGEILVYSGTPAVGNLIGSWSGAAGNDVPGNTYPPGLAVESGGLVLLNQGSSPATVTNGSTIYTGPAGRLRYLSQSGADLVLDRSALNVNSFTMGTQTLPVVMSGALNYLANEASVGSEYEVEIDGTITTPTAVTGGGSMPTFNFSFFIDGSGTGINNVTFGTVFLCTSLTVAYHLRWTLTINTTGSSGTCDIIASGGAVIQFNSGSQFNLGNYAPTRTAPGGGGGQGSTPINQITAGKAIDTTTAHTFAIYGNWGTSTGATGQSAITYRTKITRRN